MSWAAGKKTPKPERINHYVGFSGYLRGPEKKEEKPG
jgi:hypothetical protein